MNTVKSECSVIICFAWIWVIENCRKSHLFICCSFYIIWIIGKKLLILITFKLVDILLFTNSETKVYTCRIIRIS